jgi:hypothetical protein
MSHVFVSHVAEDAATGWELAGALEEAGYTTWFYERDRLPRPPYVIQILQAIAQSMVVLVLVSTAALGSWQVDRDIFQAFTTQEAMVPVLIGITHEEVRHRHREWVLMFGPATWLSLPPDGISAFIPRLVQGLKSMGAEPMASSQ